MLVCRLSARLAGYRVPAPNPCPVDFYPARLAAMVKPVPRLAVPVEVGHWHNIAALSAPLHLDAIHHHMLILFPSHVLQCYRRSHPWQQ